MGIFTRFRDIINANLNAMLDKAEDPEKLIKLMIREIEDTLVELKASCAGVMASRRKVQRQIEAVQLRTEYWNKNAELAVRKNRDGLAREALVEKRRCVEKIERLEEEDREFNNLIEQYQKDIQQLEDRLHSAREKQRMLVQRHILARRKKRAREEIRQVDGFEAIAKFEQLENRIERMEAEAELVNLNHKPVLTEEFDNLSVTEEIEKELQNLKSTLEKKTGSA
ncbi:MAG: PspA/IM30 family protein [Desulfobacterales bacterium]